MTTLQRDRVHVPRHDPPRWKRFAVAYLRVLGMESPRCVQRVRVAMLRLKGVSLAEVWLSSELAVVLYDPRQVTPSELEAAVAAAGHDDHRQYRGEFLAEMSDELTQ